MVPGLNSFFIPLVILFERSDKTGLGAEASEDLEVIVYKGCARLPLEFLVDFVIAREAEVDRPPQVVALVHRVFLCNLIEYLVYVINTSTQLSLLFITFLMVAG